MHTPHLRRPRLAVTVFAQRDGAVRLGWHPEHSYVITPPRGIDSDVLLELLRRLDGVHSRAHMIWYASTVGLSANAMSTLLAELAESGLLIEGSNLTSSHNVDDPVSPTVIGIVGRGPVADAVAAGLTPSPLLVVRRSAVAPAQRLRTDDEQWRCNIVVLTDDMAPDPRIVTALVRTRTPHLQVRLREGRGIVGPFVLPGASSCLRCADLVRCDMEPGWPHISAQLLGRVGDASKPTILATAAIALAQVESFVFGRQAPMTDVTTEVDLQAISMTRRSWPRHPLCDCAG